MSVESTKRQDGVRFTLRAYLIDMDETKLPCCRTNCRSALSYALFLAHRQCNAERITVRHCLSSDLAYFSCSLAALINISSSNLNFIRENRNIVIEIKTILLRVNKVRETIAANQSTMRS